MSPEHQFLAANVDNIIHEFSKTSLLGIFEDERKKFDYSCIVQRDLNRDLITQVLWRNHEGIEKDLRTLIHEKEAKLKLYLFKDSSRSRAKIAEIIGSYKSNPETKKMLRGLRFFPIPPDFDADDETQRKWCYESLKSSLLKDIIFHIVFGNFSKFDFEIFSDYGGPFGLKYAVLDEITTNGLSHRPTFKERLGYKTEGTIRECITMLKGIGLIRNSGSVMCYPTI